MYANVMLKFRIAKIFEVTFCRGNEVMARTSVLIGRVSISVYLC